MMMILIKTLVTPRITPASNSWLTTHEEKKEENHLQYIVHMIVSSTLKQKSKNNKKKEICQSSSQFVNILRNRTDDSDRRDCPNVKFEKQGTCERLYLFNSSYLRL